MFTLTNWRSGSGGRVAGLVYTLVWPEVTGSIGRSIPGVFCSLCFFLLVLGFAAKYCIEELLTVKKHNSC